MLWRHYDLRFKRLETVTAKAVADLHSKILDLRPNPIFFIFMHFSEKIGQIIACPPWEILLPPQTGILDSLLSTEWYM